jgi:hypothetical protein
MLILIANFQKKKLGLGGKVLIRTLKVELCKDAYVSNFFFTNFSKFYTELILNIMELGKGSYVWNFF